MKNDFLKELESVIFAPDFATLKLRFCDLHDDFLSHKQDFSKSCAKTQSIKTSTQVAEHFLSRIDSVKSAMKIRRVNNANSKTALAKILHSVAHIEASAIILALDAVYRFGAHFLDSQSHLDSQLLADFRPQAHSQSQPAQIKLDSKLDCKNLAHEFCADWLRVAQEEISHFENLNFLLSQLGFKYGDFAVHSALFDALILSQNDLITRMGVVHRGLEAKGLDANIFVKEKLLSSSCANELKSAINDVFGVILRDEILHASKGDKWFKIALDSQNAQRNAQDEFLDICAKFKNRFYLAGKVMNRPARLAAGFTESELDELEKLYKK